MSQIETNGRHAMVHYAAPACIDKNDTPKPGLMSLLDGGFNFGECKQVKEERNDPETPFIFHGEEYARVTRLWSAVYDFYAFSEGVAYHWYETRKVVWELNWSKRYAVQLSVAFA